MARHFWRKRFLFPWPKTGLVGVTVMALALLALACAPAAQPEAAPAGQASPEQVAATATPVQELISAQAGRPSEEGTYVERAGLRFFIPKGYALAGPSIPADPREPRYGGIFTHAAAGDAPSLDAHDTTGSQAYNRTSSLFDRLIHFPVGPGIELYGQEIIPGLATSWEISDDFMTYTLHLRQGVKWPNVPPVNGREFTSEDVVFTINYYQEPDSVIKGRYAAIKNVEAVDKYTVVLHMKEMDLSLLDGTLAEIPRGYMLPKEHKQLNRRVRIIGTGPFVMEGDYEFKVGLNARRNPDYWLKDAQGKQMPYVDGWRTRVMDDASARLAAFRTGKIDVGAPTGSPQAARDLLKSNPNTIVRESIGVQSLVGVGFRLDKEPFNDVRVRRALSLAVNYDEWARTLYEIGASPSVMINGYFTGEPNTPENYGEWYQYNPQKAKALLAEAGYPNGLTVTVEYFIYDPTHTETHELLTSYWKAIGVTSQIKSMDYTIFRTNLDKGTWTDLSGWAFTVPFPSSVYTLVAPLVPGGPQNTNMGNLNDPEVTRMVKEIQALYKDTAKQTALLKQLRRRLIDQVYEIPWQYGHSFAASQPWLRNYPPDTQVNRNEVSRQAAYAWIDDDWRR
ncbi:MAG: ABC transporter substrate-binding protein [Dehalococcoidia bacterium]|nr:ABC transporter substrate-binding protein [Dehalococcoidia bacterium]